jgi:adenosylcobinamide kinase / adenosylcobinamide-phosphate guanylyltransferase
MPIILITGGARSGKSTRAEQRARNFAGKPVYIATAEGFDHEMRERIAKHRARRGDDWIEHETPLDLVPTLNATDGGGARLIDCLTLWLSNLMLADADVAAETERLERALCERAAPVVMVANEVGSGIVPENALARSFRDQQGILNQRIAALADRVVLMVAGLPLSVKGSP